MQDAHTKPSDRDENSSGHWHTVAKAWHFGALVNEVSCLV